MTARVRAGWVVTCQPEVVPLPFRIQPRRRRSPLQDAIKRVADGGTALDREVVAELVKSRGSDDSLGALTPRETEVLSLMAEGRTNSGIADALVVTPGAVEKHISSIFSKLDLSANDADHRRVLAVLTFLQAAG